MTDDEGTRTLHREPRYEVRISSLQDFATLMERELGASVDPGFRRIDADAPHGLRWGSALHSHVVGRSRSGYSESQRLAVANVHRYLRAGAVMIEVIDRLMATYCTSEEMAALTPQEVLQVFTEARRDVELGEAAARLERP